MAHSQELVHLELKTVLVQAFSDCTSHAMEHTPCARRFTQHTVSEPFGHGKHRGLLMEEEAVLTSDFEETKSSKLRMGKLLMLPQRLATSCSSHLGGAVATAGKKTLIKMRLQVRKHAAK